MRNAYNKKKLNLLNFRNYFKYFIIIFFISSLFFFIYNEFKNEKNPHKLIQMFSDKFEYNFEIYKINKLQRVDKIKVSEIIQEYLGRSIFLIPLNIISNKIHEMKWVKRINLTTNLKNKIIIEIIEFEPIGIYAFNDNFFYFSDKGKIIDQLYIKDNKNLIVFYGNQSHKKAYNFLNIVNNIKKNNLPKIINAYFINNRRWNIKLDNDLMLYLPENNIENSLSNYAKLIHKLEKSEIASIKSIDLRNNNKAIINLKTND